MKLVEAVGQGEGANETEGGLSFLLSFYLTAKGEHKTQAVEN